MLKIHNFSYQFSEERIEVEPFDLSPGQVVFVTGPSGAGKTTFLHGLLGWEPSVQFQWSLSRNELKKEGNQKSLHRKLRIGLSPQSPLFFESTQLGRQLQAVCKRSGAHSLLASGAKALEINYLMERLPSQVSGGQLKRFSVLQALCSLPDLLLLDEPISNLDPDSQTRVLDLVLDHVQKTDCYCVLVSHTVPEGIRESADQSSKINYIEFRSLN